jgi:hypothetical protein
MYSDHAPILAVLNSTPHHTNKPFRFENWWLREQEFQDIAKQSWQRSSTRDFSHKTKFLAADLRKWRKKPKNSDMLAQIETQILDQQTLHPSLQNHNLQQQLHNQHQDLLAKEAAYHIQHVKMTWPIEGDRNTSFFHLAIIKRNRKNKISYLMNPDGSHSTTPDQLAATVTNYFKTIFTTSFNPLNTAPPNHLPTPHSPDNSPSNNPSTEGLQGSNTQTEEGDDALHSNAMFRYTYSILDLKEIHDIITKMRNNVALGPDGLNAAFYKSAWSWAQHDIHKVVAIFYTHAVLPPDINKTFISLIPKKNNPTLPQDYRPICLCNVIYKIIVKSLANRVKHHLPNYVSHSQYAFIAHRHISSNIIITQEIIHSLNLKSWTSDAHP